MRVEFAESPIAIGTRKPRFSWVVDLEGRNRKQSAYQILVSHSKDALADEKGEVWDSGKVCSSQSVHVVYEGTPLQSNCDYFWCVKVWDENGQSGEYSEKSYFGTALFDSDDWQAGWIGMGPVEEPLLDPYCVSQADGKGLQIHKDSFDKLPEALRDQNPELRSPIFRKVFSLEKQIKRARCYVCGLGLIELRLNGEKVGDDVLATPRTDFRKRAYYSTYDVTSALQTGNNAIGIILGNGWYNAQKKYWHWQAPWFGSPRALVQIEIEYADGSQTRVCSDSSWKGDWSPLTLNCIYDGENYDARLEQLGWDTPRFDDETWVDVNLVAPPGGTLVALDHEPNRIVKRFTPVAISEPEKDIYVFDMGTVMTGWVSLTIPKGIRGETVSLHYAELQYLNGMINPKSNGDARQTDHYIMKGSDNEIYEPRFTYHGFRYVEVRGFPGKPKLGSVEACFVYNGVQESGTFECENALINKIHACTLQSQRCNLQMGVPTDDTQREERLGWCGDAWSYAQECFYNFDSARFWEKWIADFYDQQNEAGLVGFINPLPGFHEDLVWSAAFVLIPWWHYVHYGDKRILEKSYPYLKKYMTYLERTGKKKLPEVSQDGPAAKLFPSLSCEERYADAASHGYLQHSLFGDHLATNEGASGMGKDQPRSMATAFYHMDALVMTKIARVLGYASDAKKYADLGGKIRDAYHDKFYDPHGRYYDVGCQSAQALALGFGLVPDDERQHLQGYLNSSVNYRQRRITSGYAGTKWVIDALGKSSRSDIVWARAISTDYPSWGYMLHDDKTTITENWIGEASQCHTTLGAAIDEWFYWGLAGIHPDSNFPGFCQTLIQPYIPSDLHWAKAQLKTLRGVISSEWRHDDKTVSLSIHIPANCTAEITIPCDEASDVFESGAVVSEMPEICLQDDAGKDCIVCVGSGEYVFQFPMRSME